MDTSKPVPWIEGKPLYYSVGLSTTGWLLLPREPCAEPPKLTYDEAKRRCLTLLPEAGERFCDIRAPYDCVSVVTKVTPVLGQRPNQMVVETRFEKRDPTQPHVVGIHYSIDSWWDGLFYGTIIPMQ